MKNKVKMENNTRKENSKRTHDAKYLKVKKKISLMKYHLQRTLEKRNGISLLPIKKYYRTNYIKNYENEEQ